MFRCLRRLAPLVSLVLLAWTAADLVGPDVCLRERRAASDGGAVTADGVVTDVHADVDDCFCCARCLDTSLRAPMFRGAHAWTDFDEPIRHLAQRPASLDHPPQNA